MLLVLLNCCRWPPHSFFQAAGPIFSRADISLWCGCHLVPCCGISRTCCLHQKDCGANARDGRWITIKLLRHMQKVHCLKCQRRAHGAAVLSNQASPQVLVKSCTVLDHWLKCSNWKQVEAWPKVCDYCLIIWGEGAKYETHFTAAKMAQFGAQFGQNCAWKKDILAIPIGQYFFCSAILGTILVKPLAILDKPCG